MERKMYLPRNKFLFGLVFAFSFFEASLFANEEKQVSGDILFQIKNTKGYFDIGRICGAPPENVAVKLYKLQKYIKDTYPEIPLEIFLTPEAALYKHNEINSGTFEKNISIKDAIDYFCSSNNLFYQVKNNKLYFDLKRKRDVPKEEKVDLYQGMSCKTSPKITDSPIIIKNSSSDSVFILEYLEEYTFFNIQDLMTYLSHKNIDPKENCFLYIPADKINSCHDWDIAPEIFKLAKEKNIVYYSQKLTSKGIGKIYSSSIGDVDTIVKKPLIIENNSEQHVFPLVIKYVEQYTFQNLSDLMTYLNNKKINPGNNCLVFIPQNKSVTSFDREVVIKLFDYAQENKIDLFVQDASENIYKQCLPIK